MLSQTKFLDWHSHAGMVWCINQLQLVSVSSYYDYQQLVKRKFRSSSISSSALEECGAFETSGTIYQLTQHNNPQGLYLQSNWYFNRYKSSFDSLLDWPEGRVSTYFKYSLHYLLLCLHIWKTVFYRYATTKNVIPQ